MNEYRELPLNDNMQKRREYWEVAKGLQAADGLATSEYLESVIQDTLTGRYDTAEAAERVGRYYEENDTDGREKEADLSAARITYILERGGFSFSPVTLQAIHRELFADVFKPEWVGAYRTVNLEKSEDVLNGRSVQYADYRAIADTLAYDFGEQKKVCYRLPFDKAQVASIAGFISDVWQVHPFREGNTRTAATFLMLYLQNLGISIDNEPFREHAKYFRDALVRSNYASVRDGIAADNSFLMMFFENILLHAEHDLNAQDLRCRELFAEQYTDRESKRKEAWRMDEDHPLPPESGFERKPAIQIGEDKDYSLSSEQKEAHEAKDALSSRHVADIKDRGER